MGMPEFGADSRRSRRVDHALEILNMEPSEEMLRERIERATGDAELARLAPAIFARREEVGGFQEAGDLDGINGLSDDVWVSLVDGLNLPPYEFESETLESIVWTHGSGLQVETPEAFGAIHRRRDGLHIYGPVERDPAFARSWVHAPVAVPTYSRSGSRLYVRSVLLNFRGSPAAADIYGSPVAGFAGLEVRDGHERVAVVDGIHGQATKSVFRYLRVPVESSQSLRWGLSISLDLLVRWTPEGATFSVSISSVGVELVTRTGLRSRLPGLG